MEETKYPLIPDGLLFYLKEQFPDKVPMGDVTPRELGFQQGIQNGWQNYPSRSCASSKLK